MSDTSTAVVPPVAVPVAPPVAAVVVPPKPKRFTLVDEWDWVLAHSWSLRFVFLAFVFSALEVALPLVTALQGLPFFPILIGLTTGAAFVARLVAQNRDGK